MKLYLAGPMTGHKWSTVQERFFTAAKVIRAQGHEVWSPAENQVMELPDAPTSYRDCFKVDLPALLECDGIVLLPGWRGSNGATLEARLAKLCGLQFFYYNEALTPLENVVI